MGFRRAVLSLSTLFWSVRGEIGGLHKSDDLLSFRSRPDLRPPKFYVNQIYPDKVSPGYYFTAPYAHSELHGEGIWAACQAGPAIYDSDGELVWTGGCEYGTVYDFKVVDCDDGEGACMGFNTRDLKWSEKDHHGAGVILDNTFQIKTRINVDHEYDLHEWNVLPGGRTALYVSHVFKSYTFENLGLKDGDEGYLRWTTFNEVDLESGKNLWRWETPEHLNLNQSTFHPPEEAFERKKDNAWDFDHANSIDKDQNGDFIASYRHTNCILKISGDDGAVMWQLGGIDSDFDMTDLHFSRQHHARFLESTEDYTLISFFDNASGEYGKNDNEPPSHDFSRSLIVKAHHPGGRPTKAETVRAYDRPDEKLTELRGSTQVLDNGSIFSGWSFGGYQSEHLEDGTLVEESGFVSERYSTYRSYKYEFVGMPHEPPHVVAEVLAADNTVVTAFYISWNGATEVDTWNFYSAGSDGSQSDFLGTADKLGFETTWVYEGYVEQVYAEGVDARGEVLGKTKVEAAALPTKKTASKEKQKHTEETDETEDDEPQVHEVPTSHGWEKVDQLKDRLGPLPQDVQFPAMMVVLLLIAVTLWLGRRRLCAPMLRTVRRRMDHYKTPEEMSVA